MKNAIFPDWGLILVFPKNKLIIDHFFSFQSLLHKCSNHGPLLVLRVTQTGTSSANGAVGPVSSSLVITCCAKSLPETLLVLSVQERVPLAVLIAEEPVFVQSGWANRPLKSRSFA